MAFCFSGSLLRANFSIVSLFFLFDTIIVRGKYFFIFFYFFLITSLGASVWGNAANRDFALKLAASCRRLHSSTHRGRHCYHRPWLTVALITATLASAREVCATGGCGRLFRRNWARCVSCHSQPLLNNLRYSVLSGGGVDSQRWRWSWPSFSVALSPLWLEIELPQQRPSAAVSMDLHNTGLHPTVILLDQCFSTFLVIIINNNNKTTIYTAQ